MEQMVRHVVKSLLRKRSTLCSRMPHSMLLSLRIGGITVRLPLQSNGVQMENDFQCCEIMTHGTIYCTVCV